LADLSR
jgi:hypothetical protein